MSRSIRKRIAGRTRATVVVATVAALFAAASAEAAGERWTRTVAVDLSARELGLPAGASAHRLARSALAADARRLGLRGSVSSLRLETRLRTPAADGARAFDQLRFQQTAAGLRLVWSQIDVTVVGDRVRSISATVVPVKSGPPAGERRVSRERAKGIALRAVPGAEGALDPLAAAYAGNPTAERGAKARTARRAWVVEVEPASEVGEESATPLCIVVDAETGDVIGRWPGIADRPESGSEARGAIGPGAQALGRDARDGPAFVLDIADGAVSTDPNDVTAYGLFVTEDDPRVSSNWPSYQEARNDRVPLVPDLEAVSANAANVARTICVVRGYCGERGGFGPAATNVFPWLVFGRAPGSISSVSPTNFSIELSLDDTMFGNGDPNQPANDVVAHEFGHVMDWVYAGDRCLGAACSDEGEEVEEALADMFAYEYDRFDTTFGEESRQGLQSGHPYRNWANPPAEALLAPGGPRPYPAHMNDYYEDSPADHLNSTILSHAYVLFVQRVGHAKAGRVLHNVPSLLSPRPTFREVSSGFFNRASQIYGSSVAASARTAFTQVGLPPG